MSRRAVLATLAAGLLLVAACGADEQRLPPADEDTGTGFTVTTTSFPAGGDIPARYACPDQGDGVSPALTFRSVPADARSLAVLVTDPDAGGYVHWAVAGLPPSAAIEEGGLPPGAVAGSNDSGSTGWFGPCPPSGTHTYVVTAYALDVDPALPRGFTPEQLTAAAEGHLLAQASLDGTFASQG